MTQEALKLALEFIERVNKDGWIFADFEPEMYATITAIKEALAQRTEQEPVAYLCENAVGHKYFRWKKPTSIYKPIALYTRPPQRKPLTDEQVEKIIKANMSFQMNLAGIRQDFEAAHGIKE